MISSYNYNKKYINNNNNNNLIATIVINIRNIISINLINRKKKKLNK